MVSATAPTAGSSTRGPGRTPQTSHPSFFGPLTNTLQDCPGGHYAADPADHVWATAVATGGTPMPLYSPPLRHSGSGLNMAARHILLALYLHHRGLHLPDPHIPTPHIAAPAPEAWPETAPEDVAD